MQILNVRAVLIGNKIAATLAKNAKMPKAMMGISREVSASEFEK
jgi:hypothetical protein